MTIEDFNIKYKDYLSEGYYGLAIHDPKVIKFLDNIFSDLTEIPNFEYQQIKLKFGSCRFYSNLQDDLNKIIEDKINKIISDKV